MAGNRTLPRRKAALRNEDEQFYEDAVFLKLLSEKLLLSSCRLLLRNPFSTVMDDSVRMPNFQKTSFWSVSSENGI